MKATKDMSEAQFRKAAEKSGFRSAGFMGYWSLPEPHSNVSVCRFNGGQNRREQLAYLIAQQQRKEHD